MQHPRGRKVGWGGGGLPCGLALSPQRRQAPAPLPLAAAAAAAAGGRAVRRLTFSGPGHRKSRRPGAGAAATAR
eukprot:6646196-Prymnesium_polylepis.1